MKTIMIPTFMSPYKCTINGVTYVYPAGTEQTVPDEVAALIEANAAAMDYGKRPAAISEYIMNILKGAENVNVEAIQTPTGTEISITNRDGETTTVFLNTLPEINNFSDVARAVKLGFGPTLFPVGYEFEVPKAMSITAEISEGSTGITAVTINDNTFLSRMGEVKSGIYEFGYDGEIWKLGGNGVILSDYGLSITGTAAEGDKILVTETAMNVVFRVVAHDHHEAADGHYIHTMTLEAKYVYGTAESTYKGLNFDAAEALYYCSEALPAGTYNFTWNFATGSMVKGTYQFTLEEDVPAGGQIVLGTSSSSTAITSCKIKTYGSVGSNTAIESNIAVTEGSGGTSLGTIGATTADSANLNCAHRIMWGSNNYAQSGVRQWLNSAANLGSVWTPTNKFDRAPSWHTGSDSAYRGFMHGLGDDFLGAIQPAKIACRTNSNFEVDSLDGTEFTVNQVYELKDKFFLLSRPEIYGTYDSTSYKDGTQLEYYEGLTQTELIKRDAAGSARHAWLRSPLPSYASSDRRVNTDGKVDGDSAIFTNTVAPACIIA